MDNNWKPKVWIAVLLGIVIPAFAFLYLNKARIFWLYIMAGIVVIVLSWQLQSPLTVLFNIICPIHAYLIAKKYEPSNERVWYSKWWGIPAIFASVFAVIFLVRSFFYEPFTFPSGSMKPTIMPGNQIIVQKLGYGTYGTYGLALLNKNISSTSLMKRGAIYAFYPSHNDLPHVKRLIALPGDRLTIVENDVVINDNIIASIALDETDEQIIYQQQLDTITYRYQRTNKYSGDGIDEIVIPENSYFFMGDNRDNSSDSRHWGFVTGDRIIGKVIYIFNRPSRR